MIHSLSIIPVPELVERLLAKHQSDACCPLSLPPSRRSGALARREGGRERVRVRGKYWTEHAKFCITQKHLSQSTSPARDDSPCRCPVSEFRARISLRAARKD